MTYPVSESNLNENENEQENYSDTDIESNLQNETLSKNDSIGSNND